ncbi:phage tail tube protein [Psychrobacter sp. I-STPA6b]|uniref:phage tail tube protein n=1 Tax=Psychrobacter sp. I-STPA6b TaxID=2585718 RepID=UPI001D0C8B1B|nr:phage tail tube protein [Psychrobacter sp. I-STPA6b]
MKKLLSAGTVVELGTTKAENLDGIASAQFTDISCALTGLSTESSENEQIDVTTLCQTYSKEYLDGLKDADTASSDAFFNPSSDEGKALMAAAVAKEKRILRVTFTDGSKWACLCRVQPFGFNTNVGDAVKTTLNFKLSGEPEITTA